MKAMAFNITSCRVLHPGLTLLLLCMTSISEAAPANDNFADAEIISGQSGSVFGSNVGATTEAGEPAHAGTSGGGSVWYRWTASADLFMEFDTFGSGFDTVLAVYTGNQVSSLNELVSNDDAGSLQSLVQFPAVSGTVYYIAVGGYSTFSRGSIVLNWAEVPSPPANDAFESPQSLGSSLVITVAGTTEGATSQLVEGEPDLSDDSFWIDDQTVWYVWTAPAGSTWMRVSVSGTNLINQIAVYTGSVINALDPVSINLRETPGDNRTTFPVVPGTQYRIRVSVPGYAIWWLPWDETPIYDFNLSLKGIANPVTDEDYVLRGRGRLQQGTPAASVMARDDFATAAGLNSSNEEALFLLAFSQLLALEGETQFTSLLQDLGIPIAGSFRDGGYSIPEDMDGYPVFDEDADSASIVAWLNDAVLPRLSGIRTTLGGISSAGFRTDLTSAETGIVEIIVDTGDALALKAATHALDMMIHLLTTYNLSVPLQGLVELDRDGELSAEKVLEIHTALLGFSSTDRRQQLADSLTALENDYLAASDFIRNTRVNADGLLTESLSENPEKEEALRGNLAAAVQSLDEEITHSGTRVNLSAFLTTTASPRDWLPPFKGNDVFGAFPDPTFDGILPDNTNQIMRNQLYDLGRLWGMSQYAAEIGQYLEYLGLPSRPDDDADRDGRSNFAEWIFATDPSSPDVVYQELLPEQLPGGGGVEIRFSFIRSIWLEDWRLVVLVSDDMQTWDDTETTVEPVGEPQPTGDGFSEIATYRLINTGALPPKKFFRVEARPKTL